MVFLKRIFDILFSLIGLIILSLLFLLLAFFIKTESKGSVFYRGKRIGQHGKLFKIFKFRSMVKDAESIGASSTSTSDIRITKCGKFIRKYKLDELPQLINVLLGDMSIVGPRPQVKWAVDSYSEEEKELFQIRPGITDWAAIKFNNEAEIIERFGASNPDETYMKFIHPEKMQLQLKYLKEHSLWVDFKIIS